MVLRVLWASSKPVEVPRKKKKKVISLEVLAADLLPAGSTPRVSGVSLRTMLNPSIAWVSDERSSYWLRHGSVKLGQGASAILQ